MGLAKLPLSRLLASKVDRLEARRPVLARCGSDRIGVQTKLGHEWERSVAALEERSQVLDVLGVRCDVVWKFCLEAKGGSTDTKVVPGRIETRLIGHDPPFIGANLTFV